MNLKKILLILMIMMGAFTGGAAQATMINQFLFNGNATDTGSMPLAMTIHGSITFANDAPSGAGQSAAFSNESFIRADGTPNNNVSGDFSVAFWMNTSMTSRTGNDWHRGSGLVDAERAGFTSDWGISLLNSKVAFGIGGAQGDKTIQSDNVVNDGLWHFVVASWDVSTGAMALYVDGSLTTTGTGGANVLRSNQNNLALGEISTDRNRYTGKLADVRIFDNVLTAQEVASMNQLGAQSCARTLNPTELEVASPGGSGFSVSVTVPPGCNVTANGFFAKSNDSWIHLTGGGPPQSDGSVQYFGSTVTYSVDPNPSPNVDTGTITIAGKTFTVTQLGFGAPSCTRTLNPTSATIPAAGGTGFSVSATIPANCTVTANGIFAKSNVSWIHLTGGGPPGSDGSVQYFGSTVTYNVDPNPGPNLDTGTITIAGKTFTVSQLGAQTGTTPPPSSASALEIPGPGSFNSGIGQISGWSCAGPVTVSIDGKPPLATSYGSSRGDTASACSGKVDNGFILLTNYNLLGPGAHTAQILVKGVPAGNAVQFNVTVPAGEFMVGASGGCTAENFPSTGTATSLTWQQGMQNFAITSNVNLPPITPLPDSTSSLEIPGPGSFNSGIGQISGWSCAGPVTVSIDGKPPLATSYGSSRGDTAGVCGGKVDNGFILLTNYNLLGPGAHTAQILVNGAPKGSPTSFAVSVPGGVEFLTGASGGCTVLNFPSVNRSTVLNWQQSIQNFSIQSVNP